MATAVLSGPPTAMGGPSRVAAPVSTASGLLAMLSEPSPALVSAALTRLLAVVDTLWHEVAESLPDLEAIAEGGSAAAAADAEGDAGPGLSLDDSSRRTAAAIASRVYFHLEEPVQSLRLALDAGVDHFNPASEGSRGDPYVECLVGAALEAYVKRGRAAHDASAASAADGDAGAADGADDGADLLDSAKLSALVDLMFVRCYADGRYGHALGVALEGRCLAKVAECLAKSGDGGATRDQLVALRYALDAAVALVADDRAFRDAVVGLVATHLSTIFTASPSGSADHSASAVALCVANQLLNRPQEVGKLLTRLLGGEEKKEGEVLLGLQLCFDMVDSGDEAFVGAVADALPGKKDKAKAESAADGGEGEEETKPESEADATSDEAREAYAAARRILTGGFVTELSLSFLHKNSDSDPLIMDQLRKALDERGNARNSVLHNCGVGTHAVLNAGTTNDAFLRDHLDWMKKASNWYVGLRPGLVMLAVYLHGLIEIYFRCASLGIYM